MTGRKTVTLIYPSVTDKDEVVKCEVTFKDEQDCHNYCRTNNGRIKMRDEERGIDRFLPYDEIVDGGVYAIGGEFFRAVAEDKQHRQVDAKVFEHESALAVQREVGKGAHIHENILFEHDKQNREIDGIVLHLGGKDVPNSTAYIIEAQISPPLTKIDKLLDKVRLFEKFHPSSSHFNSVTKVVPVLAGKRWSEDVIKACAKEKIWRVTPSANGYKIIRSFHTLLLKIKK